METCTYCDTFYTAEVLFENAKVIRFCPWHAKDWLLETLIANPTAQFFLKG